MTEEDTTDPFLRLDWSVLEEWAGEKTLSRGRKYQRQGRVHDLVLKDDRTIVAYVEGTREYSTAVVLDNGIQSICTCPVGSACKHAIAVIFEYIAMRKENKTVRKIRTDDRRLSLLGIRLEPGYTRGTAIRQTVLVSTGDQGQERAHGEPGPVSIRRYLESLQKEELIDLIDDLALSYPVVEQEIIDQKSVSCGDAGPVLTALLSAIDSITAEDGGDDSWGRESGIPDYSPVRKRMDILLMMGFPDAVVRAGCILMKKGAAQVESIHDEGETADEIASCMEIVFLALAQSSLPLHEQIIYAIDAELDDEYDFCPAVDHFWKQQFPGDEWGLVADRLLQRLRAGEPGSRESIPHYKRDRLVNWTTTALDNAGREDEATDLCIAEVEQTDGYVRLVRRLIRLGHVDEAQEWIAGGIAITHAILPGIAADLRAVQREQWEQEGDWLRVASLCAGEFLDRPSFPKYRRMEESALKAGAWETMKESVMQYLETGKLTGKQGGGPDNSGKLFGILPDTGLFTDEARRAPQSPFFDLLIDIAIEENCPEDVVLWYDRYRTYSPIRGQWYVSDDKVADAVAEKFPDRALGIWESKTDRLVAEARPKSYESAIGYLKKIRGLMVKQGQKEEWERYLAQIRNGNARKKRFLEMLDVLEGKKILKA